MTLQEDVDNLVYTIYDRYCTGGPLHIILDDFNINTKYIRWCMENTIPNEEDIVVKICSQKLCELLLPLELTERIKILKIDEDDEVLMAHLKEIENGDK